MSATCAVKANSIMSVAATPGKPPKEAAVPIWGGLVQVTVKHELRFNALHVMIERCKPDMHVVVAIVD